MARVTVEDCIEKVPNRFGLVLLAGHRARSVFLPQLEKPSALDLELYVIETMPEMLAWKMLLAVTLAKRPRTNPVASTTNIALTSKS